MLNTKTFIKTADKLFIGMDLHKNTSTFMVKDKEWLTSRLQVKRLLAVATAAGLVLWKTIKVQIWYRAFFKIIQWNQLLAVDLTFFIGISILYHFSTK